jgi:hypothetical protein
MATRPAGIIAATALIVCQGCGAPSASQNRTVPRKSQLGTTPGDVAIYSLAPTHLRVLAGQFVRAIAEYDTRTERRQDFLHGMTSLASRSELTRLREAPRNHLPWQVLRDRRERTRVQVSGVSQAVGGDRTRLIVVEAIITTGTDTASAAMFAEFQLYATRAHGGWLVDRAAGPEL